MSGDRVAVDEKDALTLTDLQHRGNVDRDRRLADAALGIEDDDDLAAAIVLIDLGDALGFEHAALRFDHPAAHVVGRHFCADEHRFDAPAQGFGGVGAGEVLVADPGSARQTHPVQGAGSHDHQSRDVASLIVEQAVHLDRAVEVVLAVEDGHAHVPTPVQQFLQLLGSVDLYDFVARLSQLCADRDELRLR